MTTRRRIPAAGAALGTALALSLTACSSAATSADPAAPTASAVAIPAESSAAAAPSASAATAGEPLGGPCDLLTREQIQAATDVEVPDGTEKVDDVRQIQMCTWQSSEPFLIVAASLTDVGADEAFKTNFDLAPAYFDGDPVTTTVPGADKAYAVQQPDVGWVVGAVAKGRFVQVQVGGTDITQEQAATLVQNAIERMPAEG